MQDYRADIFCKKVHKGVRSNYICGIRVTDWANANCIPKAAKEDHLEPKNELTLVKVLHISLLSPFFLDL